MTIGSTVGDAEQGRASERWSMRSLIDRFGVTLLALVAPAVALATIPIVVRTEGWDPMTYLGYVNDYEALAARFPQTYHGNRLSYVLVDRAFIGLMGLQPGYFAARYLFLAIAALSIAAIGRRLGGSPIAILGIVLVVFVPWLPRQLMWTHYDGFIATYLLAATALLLAPTGRRRSVAELAAGASFALTINGQFVSIAFIGAFGIAWLILRGRDPLRTLLASIGRLAAGAAIAFLALSVRLSRWYPEGPFFSETVAWRTAREITSEREFFIPIGVWIGGQRVLWAIAVLPALALLALLLRRRDELDDEARMSGLPADERRRWTAATLVWSTLVVGGWSAAYVLDLSDVTWVYLPYYRIFLLPLFVVAILVITTSLVVRLGSAGRRAIHGVSVVLLVVWLIPGLPGRSMSVLGIAAIVAAGVGLLLAARFRVAALAAVIAVPALAMNVWAMEGRWLGAESAAAAAETNVREWDVVRLGIELQGLVEAEVPTDRSLKFWHTVIGEDAELYTSMNMVYYGGGGQRLHRRADKGFDGMPDLEDGNVVELVLAARPVTIVLLGGSREELGAGYGRLVEAGLPARPGRAAVLEGARSSVHVLLVEVD